MGVSMGSEWQMEPQQPREGHGLHGQVGGKPGERTMGMWAEFASWVKSLCARVSVWLILILLLPFSVLWKVASKASDVPTILLCLFSFHPSLNKPASLVETALPGSSTREGLPALPPHPGKTSGCKAT